MFPAAVCSMNFAYVSSIPNMIEVFGRIIFSHKENDQKRHEQQFDAAHAQSNWEKTSNTTKHNYENNGYQPIYKINVKNLPV